MVEGVFEISVFHTLPQVTRILDTPLFTAIPDSNRHATYSGLIKLFLQVHLIYIYLQSYVHHSVS